MPDKIERQPKIIAPAINPTEINPVSRQFIEWVTISLADQQFYQQMVAEALGQAHLFYEQPHAELTKRLKAKLIRGAQEHGSPDRDPEQIRHELENEYIDVLGWFLLEKWNAEHRTD